jgi:HK97 family phage prohead protease
LPELKTDNVSTNKQTTPVKSTTREVTPLETRGALRSVNTEARTVEVVWSTGAKVLRSSWSDGPFFEELDMSPKAVRLARLNAGAPFLPNHDSRDVARTLGVVVKGSAKVDGKIGTATIRFAKAEDDPEADKVFRKIADGIVSAVSVGYRIWKAERIENPADKSTPTVRAVDWEPYEISAVALPADAGAGFRAAQKTNPCTFTFPQNPNPAVPRKTDRMSTTENQTPEAISNEDIATQERARCETIRTTCRSAGLGDELAQRLIANSTPVSEAREVILNVLAARSDQYVTNPHGNAGYGISMGETSGEKFARGAVSSLLGRTCPSLVETAKAKGVKGFDKVDADTDGEFRGLSLLDLAKVCITRAGGSTRGMGREQIVARAFAQRSGGYSGASTSDFPVLLENTLHKMLMGSYAITPDTWSKFCKVELVSDFRNANRYRNGSFGTLPVVAENAEYQTLTIPDGEKIAISVETRGAVIGLSRQAAINDDIGALTDIATRFGRSAKLSIENSVFSMLGQNSGLGPTMADGQPFFHSNRSNVSTGSALSIAAIDADRVAMAMQRDPSSNEYLDLRPSVLLTPPAIGSAARVLNSSAWDHTAATLEKPNPVYGLFKDVIDSPRLSWSNTHRYLFTDLGISSAFVIAMLEGQGAGPYLESRQGFVTDSLEWKCRMDYKVNPFDPRAAISNAGQ